MTNVPSADGPPRASALSPALIALAEARQAAQHEARRSLGIGEMDARALAFLAQNPGSRPSALRAHLGLTSAGVSTLCDRLIERGTIHRDTDPSDRRASLLTVTVDLSSSPWNRLNAFDRSLEAALAAEADPATLQRIAELLTHALSVTAQSPEGAESAQTG
ncbi:MarR family winged helix-turn-helix transcriptional regulator [Pseudoclavibacter terrae]|uniref:MarR family winged helix-turn-helix transcriptional regulator n=1 Tax=Pseudoclavibacter terrae TaxID=1530195 RepID=UPI002330E3C8|nr:helix-turn-helix domain-containing protein [Pseudoclavibacter terrae]